jgi:hypothetical protein
MSQKTDSRRPRGFALNSYGRAALVGIAAKGKRELPVAGFALFIVAGEVVVRRVLVTIVNEELGSACVTESMTGIGHVLPFSRVASETTLAAKRAAFAAELTQFQAAEAAQRSQQTVPVITTAAAA